MTILGALIFLFALQTTAGFPSNPNHGFGFHKRGPGTRITCILSLERSKRVARFCQNFDHFPKKSWLDSNVGIGSITALAIVIFAILFTLTGHKAVEVADKAVAVADNQFGNANKLLAIFLAASLIGRGSQ